MSREESAELAALRTRARQWLAREAPKRGWLPSSGLNPAALDGDLEAQRRELDRCRQCQQALCDAGFGAITFPREYGGQGLSTREQVVFNEEAGPYNLPLSELVVGLGVCAPTILALGTAEQRARYLPALLRAEEIWCQLFSEPDAGSDLPNLSTRAHGDPSTGWIVNGQKVWTSGAQHARFGILLARTDPASSRHHGLTMFVVDMRWPGIIRRPLRQMDGRAHFAEIFLDGVHVPPGHVLGEVGQGWAAALVSLMSERVTLGTIRPTAGDIPDAAMLIDQARARGLHSEPVIRQELAELVIRERVLAYTGLRLTGALLAGRRPGPEGSLPKLMDSALLGRAAALGARLQGPASLAWDPTDAAGSSWARAVTFAPGLRIAGGTDEIQRNVIAERGLGLPREPTG